MLKKVFLDMLIYRGLSS